LTADATTASEAATFTRRDARNIEIEEIPQCFWYFCLNTGREKLAHLLLIFINWELNQ